MQMDFSDQQLTKASTSIEMGRDPTLNVNAESNEQPMNHGRARGSIDARMQIERRDVQEENASG
jgi:hypothetical protein